MPKSQRTAEWRIGSIKSDEVSHTDLIQLCGVGRNKTRRVGSQISGARHAGFLKNC